MSWNFEYDDIQKLFHYPYFVDWAGKSPTPSDKKHTHGGDCFLLPYRNHKDNRYDYVLLDTGRGGTYEKKIISNMLEVLNVVNKGGVITGIILTHTDLDHSGGAKVAKPKEIEKFKIFKDVQWVAAGMTFMDETGSEWDTLIKKLLESDPKKNGWGMTEAKVSGNPTASEYKQHNDGISRRIFCSTNGQVLVRGWNVLDNSFGDSIHFYHKPGSEPLKSSSLTELSCPNESAELEDLIPIDTSAANKSSITTVYCSYPVFDQNDQIKLQPRYFCFNGDTLFYFSHLLTLGLPHNHSFSHHLLNKLHLLNNLITYPFNIPDSSGDLPADRLRNIYDKVYTNEIHYKFDTFLNAKDTELDVALKAAFIPPAKTGDVKVYIEAFKDLIFGPSPTLSVSDQKWDAFQLPHHGSIGNSLGITDYNTFPIGRSNLQSNTVDTTKLIEVYQHVAHVYFVTSAGTEQHMASHYLEAFRDSAFNGSKILVPYPSKVDETGILVDKYNQFNNATDDKFFVICRLAIYCFWNFAPIFPFELHGQYHGLKQISRTAYGTLYGMQFFNIAPNNNYTDLKYVEANVTTLSANILDMKNYTPNLPWDKLVKKVVTDTDLPLPLPPMPKVVSNIMSTSKIYGHLFLRASKRRLSKRQRIYLQKQFASFSNSNSELNIKPSIHIADWLNGVWDRIDNIDLTTYSSTTFEPAIVFQGVGDMSVDIERFFPLTLQESNFFVDVDATHDQLVTTILAKGTILHPKSSTDSSLDETRVLVYLFRTKSSHVDRSPSYTLDIVLDDDRIYKVLPTSSNPDQKKNIAVLSNELKQIKYPFPDVIYDYNPSILSYVFVYDRQYSLGELALLSKNVTTELKSIAFYVKGADMADDIVFTLRDQSDIILSSSNIDVSFTRNFQVANICILKLHFTTDFLPNDGNRYFIRGSFSLEHIVEQEVKKKIYVSDLVEFFLFSLLRKFLPETFQKYEFLLTSFGDQITSLLSMLSIRQFSGTFFGLITDIPDLITFFTSSGATNLHLMNLQSIVQFTPPFNLSIFNHTLTEINFYFQFEFEYETIFHTEPVLIDMEAHSLNLEGVIQTPNGYEIRIIYGFGDLSTLLIKKAKLHADPKVDADLKSIQDAFNLSTHTMTPSVDFFGNVLDYFPDFLRITLRSKFSFAGIEAKFFRIPHEPVSLTDTIKLSAFILSLEYFPAYNTTIYAITEFKKVPKGTNSSDIKSLGKFTFKYDYQYEQHSVGASLSLDSGTSIYDIIGLFVDNPDTYLNSFPIARKLLEKIILTQVSVQFNISTRSLEEFHLHIDTNPDDPLSIIDEYLELSSIDIRYRYSSAGNYFHFQGELIIGGSKFMVVVSRVSVGMTDVENTDTTWRIDGTALNYVESIPSVTEIYTQLKDSTTPKLFIENVFKIISIRTISFEINSSKKRVIFYLELSSLKLAIIFDDGKVNILSTLDINFGERSAITSPLTLQPNTTGDFTNATMSIEGFDDITPIPPSLATVEAVSDNVEDNRKLLQFNEAAEMGLRYKFNNEITMSSEEYVDAENIPPYKYRSFQSNTDEHVSVYSGIDHILCGTNSFQRTNIPLDTKAIDIIDKDVQYMSMHSSSIVASPPLNDDSMDEEVISVSTDKAQNSHLTNASTSSPGSTFKLSSLFNDVTTTENQFLDDFDDTIDTFNFLFPDKKEHADKLIVKLGCVYLNDLKFSQVSHHEHIKAMIDSTLTPLKLDPTQDLQNVFAIALLCPSKLITDLRSSSPPSKPIFNLRSAPSLHVPRDQLLFSLKKINTSISIAAGLYLDNEEDFIYLGDWFALSTVHISANFSPKEASLTLGASGRVINGPLLTGEIFGIVNPRGFSCGISLAVDLWAQPFSINWLFMEAKVGGTLQILPSVIPKGILFHGDFYVIPRDMQEEIKNMEKPSLKQLTDIKAQLIVKKAIRVKVLVEIVLDSPLFKIELKVEHFKLSHVLRDIFLKDVDDESDFTEITIHSGSVMCHYEVGKIIDIQAAADLYLKVGDIKEDKKNFSLFLKLCYIVSSSGFEFKAVGAMSKLKLFGDKLIIQSAGAASIDPHDDSHVGREDAILELLPTDVKKDSDFEGGPLFAISIGRENHFMFSGAITIYDFTVAFNGVISKDLFHVSAMLALGNSLFLDMEVYVDKSEFTFSSELNVEIRIVTKEVKFFGVQIFPPIDTMVNLAGSITVTIGKSGLRIAGDAKFGLIVNDLVLLDIEFSYNIGIKSLTGIVEALAKYIKDKFTSLVTAALKLLRDLGELLVKVLKVSLDAVAAVCRQIGNTIQKAIRWIFGHSESETKKAIQNVYNIDDKEWESLKKQFTSLSNAYVLQWRDNGVYNSKKYGHLVYSLLGLQNDTIIDTNVGTALSNIKYKLLAIFTTEALSTGHEALFEFKIELFKIISVESEQKMKLMKLFADCKQLAITSKRLLGKLAAMRTTVNEYDHLSKMVSYLLPYYNELKQVSEILLHQWFMDDNTILPPLLQGLGVVEGESRSLFQLVSYAIMNPFILHLEFFYILLRDLQPLLGLSNSFSFSLRKTVFNINCVVAAQALVASHYNTALLYPGVHANGTLVKADNVDYVILDSRFHSIVGVTIFKQHTVEIQMNNGHNKDNTHPFYDAVEHSPTIRTGSSLETATLHRVKMNGYTIVKYVIQIHGHLRCVSDELLHMINDDEKEKAEFVNITDYAPGLNLYSNTSFLQGFVTNFYFGKKTTLADTGEDITWSCVNYEYGSIDLDSFLYPAIITIAETDNIIFRLTPDFIFRVKTGNNVTKLDITNWITKIYQECYTLVDSQSAFHITLAPGNLPVLLVQDIRNVVHTYKPSFKKESSIEEYIQNLPRLRDTSAFKLIYHKSIVDVEKSYQLVFGTAGDYFQTSFLQKRPRSLQNEEEYDKLKENALSPDQTISELCIVCQSTLYDEDGNYLLEMEDGVYAADKSDTTTPDVTTVTIPASVTTLGMNAFNNSNIQNVIFEDGSMLKTIDAYAFYGCKQLTSIKIPKSVTSLGSFSFATSNITEITFEDESNLKHIGDYVFKDCLKLLSIHIPKSITSIGSFAFDGCPLLSSIIIPASVELIANTAFINSGITTMTFAPKTKLKSIFIPASITTIASTEAEIGAFEHSDLKTIIFAQESSLTAINMKTFYNCKSLLEINIPISVTTIGANAFKESSLQSITFDEGSLLTLIEESAFYGCKKLVSTDITPILLPILLTEIGYMAFESSSLTHINIPASVTTIGQRAFKCSHLTNITFVGDSSLEKIHQETFLGCGKLTSIDIPVSVTSIEDKAFESSGLTSILFAEGSSLMKIGTSIFAECIGLENVDIPPSVTEIGACAFMNSTLKNITFVGDSVLQTIGEGAFSYCRSLTSITIPVLVSKIQADTFRGSGLREITFDEESTLTTIGRCAFFEIAIPAQLNQLTDETTIGLTTITIPASVETIAEDAFIKSGLKTIDFLPGTQLKSIVIPASVTTINPNAFENSKLKEIIFETGSSLTRIDTNTFSGCQDLVDIVIPASVDTIARDAFTGSGLTTMEFLPGTRLKSIVIPASVITIKPNAFQNSKLDSIEFETGSVLTVIAKNTFNHCQSLTTIDIPSSVTTIEESAFQDSSVTEITIPTSVTAIHNNAFKNSNLETISFALESALETLGDFVFEGCRLQSITIPTFVSQIGIGAFTDSHIKNIQFLGGSTLKTIGEGAFLRCTNLGSISLPISVATIKKYTFSYSGLTDIIFPPNSSLESIEHLAFSCCARLTSISIPASVTTIADDAFINSGLTDMKFNTGTRLKSVVIPASVIEIKPKTFLNSQLERIIFEKGSLLTTIGESAFENCKNLREIAIPASVTLIDDKALASSGLCSIIFNEESKLTSIDDDTFNNCDNLTSITLPASITIIGKNAFHNSGLTTITLDKKSQLESIDEAAFSFCTNLTSIIIPSSVTSIGKSAFESSGLNAIIFDGVSTLSTIYENTFHKCTRLTLITIPASVTRIEKQAFKESGLKNLRFAAKSKLATISEYSFNLCRNLNSINMPDSVAVIEQYAFSESGLSSILFTKKTKLTSISNHTFFDCINLTSIVIPASITTINQRAFEGSGLKNLRFSEKSKLTINEYAFSRCLNLTIVKMPDSLTTLEKYIFSGSGLSGITFTDKSKLELINDAAFLGCGNLKSIDIPSSVEKIAENAFENSGLTRMNFKPHTKLKSITIPSTVTVIGDGAFKDSELTTITFSPSSSLQTIRKDTFYNCTKLLEIRIPTSVTKIGESAFSNSGLLRICFADNSELEAIEDYAFMGCEKLTKITIPALVTTFGENVFLDSSIKQIKFADESVLEIIPDFTFFGLVKLNSIIIPPSVTTIGKCSFAQSGLNTITFSELAKLTVIGNFAFSNCLNLKSIIIPASVTNIHNSFYKSGLTEINFKPGTQLKSITIPHTVTTIGHSAFLNSKLEEIKFEHGSKLKKIDRNTFSGCKSLSNVSIPASVTEICDSAFYLCEKLGDIAIPASVTTIAGHAFSTSGLLKITFADDIELTTIKDFTFFKCKQLTSITIPASVTTIEKDAFKCSGLDTMDFKPNPQVKSIVIPAFVTKIAENAFKDSKLEDITFEKPSTLSIIGNNAFQGCGNLTSIDIPASVIEIGDSTFNNSGLKTINFDPDSILSKLGHSAFADCRDLKSIEIPKFVTKISKNMFKNSSLSTITYATGSTLDTIWESVFENCQSLTSIMIPSSIKAIEDTAFNNSALEKMNFAPKTKLESITIPATVTTISGTTIDEGGTIIDVGAFQGSGLKSITFGAGSALESIDANTFYECKELFKIEIPTSVTTIGAYAFYECKILDSIAIPDSVTTIGEYAFRGSGIKSATFDGVSRLTTIGKFVFSRCVNLTSIRIPASVTTLHRCIPHSGITSVTFESGSRLESIGLEAFYDCQKLKSVIFESEPPLTTIGNSAFWGCLKLSSIELPASLVTISNDTFHTCKSLSSIRIPTSVTTIAITAFNGSGLQKMIFAPKTGLKSITIPATVTTISGTTIDESGTTINVGAFQGSDLESITFEAGSALKSINTNTFYECKKLFKIEIPTSVTTIGAYAFYECKILDSIAIPDSVTTIGEYAFRGSGIKSATFDGVSRLTTIGKFVFSRCVNLTSIRIPASVTTLHRCIPHSGITSVTFESGSRLESIGLEAFYDCQKLKSVIFESEPPLTTIGNSAFWGCLKLSLIELPASLVTISNDTFHTCKSLSSIRIPTSVTTIAITAFNGSGLQKMIFAPKTGLKSITIPATVTTISGTTIDESGTTINVGAFQGSDLESITFEAGSALKIIDANTFYECKELLKVELPASVTTIASHAFYGCKLLDLIEIPASVTSIADTAFKDSGLLTMKFVPGTRLQFIYIPASVTTISMADLIGGGAFKDSDLESITFEDGSGLDTIEAYTFSGCTKLSKVINMPASMRMIGAYAFYGCTALASITMPANTHIGEETFSGCSNLKNVDFSEGLSRKQTSIGKRAFYKCEALVSFICPQVVLFGDYAFEGCSSLYTFKNYTTTYTGRLKIISEGLFKDCTSLPDISLPNSVTTIARNAFQNSGLQIFRFSIFSSLSTIESSAFAECKKLKHISIPRAVTEIPENAFKNSGLQVIEFEKSSYGDYGIKTIRPSAFSRSQLRSFEAPPSLTDINEKAFEYCYFLKFTMLPREESSLLYISLSAFEQVSIRPTNKQIQWISN